MNTVVYVELDGDVPAYVDGQVSYLAGKGLPGHMRVFREGGNVAVEVQNARDGVSEVESALSVVDVRGLVFVPDEDVRAASKL